MFLQSVSLFNKRFVEFAALLVSVLSFLCVSVFVPHVDQVGSHFHNGTNDTGADGLDRGRIKGNTTRIYFRRVKKLKTLPRRILKNC